MKKYLKNFPSISGLIILFTPLFLLSLHKIFLVDLDMLKNTILLNPIWFSLLDFLIQATYVYLIVLFFIKFVKIYKEGNGFVFYLNHFIAYSLLFLAASNLVGVIFFLQNRYEIALYLAVIVFGSLVIINSLLILFILSFRRIKDRFNLSKEKWHSFLKLILVSVSFSVLAYLVSGLVGQYLFMIPSFILLNFLSCLFVLPFFKIWKKAIGDEKYNKVKVFLSTQIIITSLTLVIYNTIYSALLLLGVIHISI